MFECRMQMDLSQTCRLCLAQGGVLSSIFEEALGGSGGAPNITPLPALPLRIMACAPVQVIEGDELPSQICHRCLYQVERSYDFKEQCEKSDKTLRRYIANLQTPTATEPESNVELMSTHTSLDMEAPNSQNLSKGSDDPNSIKTTSENASTQVASEIDQGQQMKGFPSAHTPIMLLDTTKHDPITLPEEDVDSGLLESLADSEDLQVIGSEGESIPLAEDEGIDRRSLLLRVKEEFTEKSESSDDETRFRCKMCTDTFPDVDELESHEAVHEAEGPPFSCAICQRTFTERSNLDAHWRVHCGDHPFLCPVCESPFASNESLDNHLRTHKISRPYSCATCDKSFGNRSDLKKHAVIHSGLRPYKCKICPKEFSRTTNLNKHMRVHSGQRPFTCSECPKMFRTRGDLHRHEIIHTGQKPFSCHICNLSFNRKDKLTRHERLHAMDKLHPCTYCSETFLRYDDLVKHSLIHVPLPQKIERDEEPEQEVATDLSMPSKKDQLPEKVSPEEVMDEDENTMDTESDHQLQICEDGLDSEDMPKQEAEDDHTGRSEKPLDVESMVISVDPFQMDRMDAAESSVGNHVMSDDMAKDLTVSRAQSEPVKEERSPNENEVDDNVQENTKPYACEYCPKKFADKSYMKTHQLTHLGIRPHACSYCGKGFFRRRELLRHEVVHTGIKPFSCKICQKAFARSDKLMRHERTHGELKNYSCSECPAVFTRKDELARHGMCHTGERPHCCSQCFKSFFSRAELTRHEKIHAGLKPFKCDFCELSFHRRDKLNRHLHTHLNSASGTAEVFGTMSFHDILAQCGQPFAVDSRANDRNVKTEKEEELIVKVDGSIDARALARLNQNPDIHLIPLKQN